MKNDLKSFFLRSTDQALVSNRLRINLELELNKLYDQNIFERYVVDNTVNLIELKKGKHVHDYILDSISVNYKLKGKLLSGINNWFDMHSCDRQFIISKFRELYYRSLPATDLMPLDNFNFIFCKFLINELLKVLAESGNQIKFNHYLLN